MRLYIRLVFFLLGAHQLAVAQYDEQRHTIKSESNHVLGAVNLWENQDTVYCKGIKLSRTKAANATFCIDSNRIYACWFSGRDILFQRSTDGGKNFLPEEKLLISTKLGPEYMVDSIAFKNKPVLLCDLTQDFGGNSKVIQIKFRHRLYLCWTDARYSPQDKDVFLMYSDDQGENWTEPILVTYRPNHKAQFDAGMTLDYRGFLYLHYFDKQNYADGSSTDLTLAVSKNGGLKFDYYRINDEPFQLTNNTSHTINHNLQLFAYAYDDSKSYHCVAELLNDSIYAAYNQEFMAEQNFLQMPKTISFSKKITVPIELQDSETVTAAITKPLDPYFEKRVFTEKKFPKGKNKLELNTKTLGLKKGNYTLFLYYRSTNQFAWILEDK